MARLAKSKRKKPATDWTNIGSRPRGVSMRAHRKKLRAGVRKFGKQELARKRTASKGVSTPGYRSPNRKRTRLR